MKKILLRLFLLIVMFFGIIPATSFSSVYDVHKVEANVPITESNRYITLEPNNDWKSDGARFAVFLCNGSTGDRWYSMEDKDGDGIFEVKINVGENHKTIIFCRMNGGNTTNNWNNKWNQTGDLSYPTSNFHFKITSWGGGTWSNRKITVTYDSTGGSSVTNDSIIYGQKYTCPTPTMPNYIFDGWYNEKGEKVTTSWIMKLTKNHTLYAHWKRTITFYADLSSLRTFYENENKINNTTNYGFSNPFIYVFSSTHNDANNGWKNGKMTKVSNDSDIYSLTIDLLGDLAYIDTLIFGYVQSGGTTAGDKQTANLSFNFTSSSSSKFRILIPSEGPKWRGANISNIEIAEITNVTYHLSDKTAESHEIITPYLKPKFVELEGYKLEGWYTDENLINKYDTNLYLNNKSLTDTIHLYPNYIPANDHYIYVDTLDKPWDSFSVYMWSDYFGNESGGVHENNAFPGVHDPEIVTDIGNKMYKIKIDASKSYDHLIFANTANVGDEKNPKQTIDLELTPDKNYYVFTTEITKNSGGTPCYHVRYEEETDNFLHAQKNISSDVNDFRFIAGFKNKTEAKAYGGAEADLTTKQFGYKFIFVKGESSYVGYWNFNKDYKYNVIRYEGTLYESVDSTGKTGDAFTEIENDYSEFYALSLKDGITFKYSDYEQIIVVACYRDSGNKVQVIKAQEYNIVTNNGTIYLTEIER